MPGTIGKGIFNDHIIRSKWNWQFTPQLSLRVICNTTRCWPIRRGTRCYPYTLLPTTEKQFNADFLITYLIHPGNGDLCRL